MKITKCGGSQGEETEAHFTAWIKVTFEPIYSVVCVHIVRNCTVVKCIRASEPQWTILSEVII